MAAPFIVVRTYAIREGKLEGFERFLRGFFETVEANEPRLLALNAYLNEDGTEVAFVHVHPDAASMEAHERAAHEHTERARREFLGATTGLQVYGEPSEAILRGMRRLAGSGVPLTVSPRTSAGSPASRREWAEAAARDPAEQANRQGTDPSRSGAPAAADGPSAPRTSSHQTSVAGRSLGPGAAGGDRGQGRRRQRRRGRQHRFIGRPRTAGERSRLRGGQGRRRQLHALPR